MRVLLLALLISISACGADEPTARCVQRTLTLTGVLDGAMFDRAEGGVSMSFTQLGQPAAEFELMNGGRVRLEWEGLVARGHSGDLTTGTLHLPEGMSFLDLTAGPGSIFAYDEARYWFELEVTGARSGKLGGCYGSG